MRIYKGIYFEKYLRIDIWTFFWGNSFVITPKYVFRLPFQHHGTTIFQIALERQT